MEFLNQVNLRGIVSRSNTEPISGKQVTKLAVVTERARKDKDGNCIVDLTWHNIVFLGQTEKELKRGDCVDLKGWIRNIRYTDVDGAERTRFEIVAEEIKVLPPERLSEEITKS